MTMSNATGFFGFGTLSPTQRVEVAGNFKLSGTGNGIIFPDGSVMSSATMGVGGGTITGVTAGTGLTGGGTTGGVSLSLDLAFADARYMRLGTGGLPQNNAAFGSFSITNSTSGAITGISTLGTGVNGVSNLASGFAAGVSGLGSSPDGVGVDGTNVGTTGNAIGVRGSSMSSSGYGVFGHADSPTGNTIGVAGQSASSSGIGLSGFATSPTGLAVGVSGSSVSSNGVAVRGFAGATVGNSIGVAGQSQADNGIGVRGDASSSTGSVMGVLGQSLLSPSGIGVKGISFGTNGVGVLAEGAGPTGGVALHARSFSTTGIAGIFEAPIGAVLISGRQSGGMEVFRVDSLGTVTASGYVNPAGLNVGLRTDCSANQIMKWNGTAWACATDANGSGTVSAITAGSGLTGGTITSSGTIAADFTTSGGNNGVGTFVARGDHLHDGRYGRLAFLNTFTATQSISVTNTTGLFVTSSGAGAVGVTAANDDTRTGTGTAGYFNNSTGGKALKLESGGKSILTADSLGLHLQDLPFYVDINNTSITGTVLNRLAKLTPQGVGVVNAGETGGAIGIVVADAGIAPGQPDSKVALIGLAACEFDNAAVAADYVQISATVNGQCHSAGANFPSSGQVLGRVADTSGPLPFVYLFGTETRGSAPNVLTIAANSFVADPTTGGFVGSTSNGGQRSEFHGLLLNPPAKSFANVSLPQGAVITGFRGCGRDNDTTGGINFTFTLKRKLLVTTTGNAFTVAAEDIATAGSTDVTNSGDTLCSAASSLGNVVIDNTTYFYFVVLTVGGQTVEPAAVRIDYR